MPKCVYCFASVIAALALIGPLAPKATALAPQGLSGTAQHAKPAPADRQPEGLPARYAFLEMAHNAAWAPAGAAAPMAQMKAASLAYFPPQAAFSPNLGAVETLGRTSPDPAEEAFAPEFSQEFTYGYVTDYVDRGVSSTFGEAAPQAAYTLYYALMETVGLNLGVSSSMVDFRDDSGAQYEVNYETGLTLTLGEADFGLWAVHTAYPNVDPELYFDASEFGLDFNVPLTRFGGLALGWAYSPNGSGNVGQTHYLSVGLESCEFGARFPVRFAASVGRQWVRDNEAFAMPDYSNVELSANARLNGLDVSLRASATDVSKSECFEGANVCGPRLYLSVARSLRR